MSAENDNEGIRLLSFDGGGIRGLSSLIVLKHIMYRIMQKRGLSQMPLPCDYFSMMAGTSTGGFIVLMLGRLRMSVDEAIEMYPKLSKQVFAQPKSTTGDGKFSATKLEDAIKDIIRTKLGDENAKLKNDSQNACKVFVCARNSRNLNAGIPVLFRTYTSPQDPGIDCTIWEAARATSAAPTFFKRMQIGTQTYLDGGMGVNNPTQKMLEEAKHIFPGQAVSLVLSIGTGKGNTIAVPKPSFFQRNIIPIDVINAIKAIATDCETTHEQVMRLLENNQGSYFRFNVEQGMQAVSLSDWEKLADVEAHTTIYLGLEEVRKNLSLTVNLLDAR